MNNHKPKETQFNGKSPQELWDLACEEIKDRTILELAYIASLFSPDWNKETLGYLWEKILQPSSNVDFENACNILKNYGILAGQCGMFSMSNAIREVVRKSPLFVNTLIGEEIGESLAVYPKVKDSDWINLAEFLEILRHIPADQLDRPKRKRKYTLVDKERFMYNERLSVALLLKNPDFLEIRSLDEIQLNIEEWGKLIALQPRFADLCPWDQLEGGDWVTILRFQPQFAVRCPWNKFNEYNWFDLLYDQPQFIVNCPSEMLKEIDGSRWLFLLIKHPQFADKCPWEKLNKVNSLLWSTLLRRQPQFADKCPWDVLETKDVEDILRQQPQLVDRCPKEKFSNTIMKIFLEQYPEKYSWEQIGGETLIDLFESYPQISEKCPWDRLNLNGYDWVTILVKMPQFYDKCQWKRLNGTNWAFLLSYQPQFADNCPWEKLSPSDWVWLLTYQPQFAKYCDWSKLDPSDQFTLVAKYPELNKYKKIN